MPFSAWVDYYNFYPAFLLYPAFWALFAFEKAYFHKIKEKGNTQQITQ
jgi:hypothetical protein